MLGIVDEVQPLAIDDQQRRVVVLVEIPAVRVGEPRQVRFRDRALVGNAAPMHPLDQRGHRCLQIDHQVRRRRLRLEMRINLVVERELVLAQIEVRKQRVLVEQEIRYRSAPEKVELVQSPDLVDALEQEIELCR